MPQEILREMEQLVQTPTLHVRLVHVVDDEADLPIFHLYSKNHSIELSQDKMKNFPVSSYEQFEALLNINDDFNLESQGIPLEYNDKYEFQIWHGEDERKATITEYYGFQFDRNDVKEEIQAFKELMKQITKRAWNIVNTNKK